MTVVDQDGLKKKARRKQERDTARAESMSIKGEVGRQDLLDNDPIGLPDTTDKENILNLIRNYDTAHPGVIKGYVEHAKERRDAAFNDFSTVADPNMTMRHVLTLPVDLMREIELGYPLMFTNRKHLNWFKKNFPVFLTTRKT